MVEDDERKWTDENISMVALKHFPNVDSNAALKRPILYSNWLSKDYIPVDQEELRDFVKARLKVWTMIWMIVIICRCSFKRSFILYKSNVNPYGKSERDACRVLKLTQGSQRCNVHQDVECIFKIDLPKLKVILWMFVFVFIQ